MHQFYADREQENCWTKENTSCARARCVVFNRSYSIHMHLCGTVHPNRKNFPWQQMAAIPMEWGDILHFANSDQTLVCEIQGFKRQERMDNPKLYTCCHPATAVLPSTQDVSHAETDLSSNQSVLLIITSIWEVWI